MLTAVRIRQAPRWVQICTNGEIMAVFTISPSASGAKAIVLGRGSITLVLLNTQSFLLLVNPCAP